MSTIFDDIMQDQLEALGFTDREAQIYLALLEYGAQPASSLARKLGCPKSTVLFSLEAMVEAAYVQRSMRGRTQWFYADPKDLQKAKEKELKEQSEQLESVLPLLQEFKSPFSAQPKLRFFQGIDGCRKAYSLLLESTTEILEFGVHGDLMKKLGEDFMENFMAERAKRGIALKAISQKDPIHKELCKRNQEHLREIQFYPSEAGTMYSSIAIFDDQVLLLNLFQDAFAILIESKQVSETLKTIFRLQWSVTKFD